MSGRAGAADAQVRAIAGPRRLVRALLFWTISSPVLFALFPLGGCVLPVGPEFQDPPEEDNQAPYFLPPPGSMPFYEQAVTVSGMRQFEAVVGDTNRSDTLQVRWVANYPPISAATMVLPSDMSDKSGDRGKAGTWDFTVTVGCEMFMQGADNNLVVILSDRGFISPDAADAPTYVSRSQEPYNWDAPPPPDSPQFVPTMTGWRIAGCH